MPEAERDRWIEASQPAYTEYYEFTRKKSVGDAAKALVDNLLKNALQIEVY